MVVGKLATLLPLGSIAWRVGLASALCQALAATLVAKLATQLIGLFPGSDPRVARRLGIAAALLYACSYSAAFSAVRPEVYALTTLLLVAPAVLLVDGLHRNDERSLRRAAFVAALGLANHHLLALAIALPAFAILIRPWLRAAASALAVVLALSLYGYLPLRAATHPTINWGAPTTIERVLWVVSAKAFQKSVDRGVGKQATTEPAMVIGAVAAESGLIGLFGGVLGLWLLWRGHAKIAMLLGSSICLTIAAPAMVGFDEANPDAYGYLSGALALLAAVATVPIARVLVARRAATAIATALVILTPLAMLRPARFDLSHHTATDAVAAWLEDAPPRRPLVTSYFQTGFLALYAQSVEGRRPDRRVLHRHFLTYPGYRDDVLARWPDYAPLLGTRDIHRNFPDAQIEYDLDLPLPFVAASTLPDVPLSTEPQARRYVAWMRYLAVHRACVLRNEAAITAADRLASPLFATDEDYAQLLLRCRKLDTVAPL